jgi:hypothetical protein
MSEAFGLVNALGRLSGAPLAISSEIPFSGGYSGRTVALTLKLDAANG